MFGASGLNGGGFSSFGDFLALIHSGRFDPRLKNAAATEGTGADGGYFVPLVWVQAMLDKSLEGEIVRPRAALVPMQSPSVVIPGFNTLNHSQTIGGFSGEWTGENSAATNQKPKIRAITLMAKKLRIYAEATNELLYDAPSFEAELGTALINAIGWYLDYGFLRGTGAGEPLGVLNDPALITVAAEGGQTADTVVAANVYKMYSRLHPQCVRTAVWVTSSTALPQLLALGDAIRNVAGTENVGGLNRGPLLREASPGSFTLLGLPVIFSEKMSAIGDVGDILLADFSQYAVGMRKEVSVERSQHAGWSTDTSHYRCILRADGQGKWSSPMTPKVGNTLSWAVTLAAR